MRACLVFASTELPQTFTLSSELANRAVGYELFDRCEWGRPNISRLRHDDKLRAALDLITSSVWWRLAAEGPGIDWRQYAMEHFGAHDIGLTERDDDVLRGRVEVLRKLYQYFRTAQPSEFATDDEAYKTYLDASQAREPGKILGQLIDMTADRKAQTPQINELKKTRLEPILGFDEPKIRLRIQRRGPRYLVKFSLANKSKKIARENLPELRQLPSEHQEPGAETF